MHRPPATFQVDGTAIRTRRMELGLTQDECAARTGITREYLSQLETGARERMRPPTYRRLCQTLKTRSNIRRLLAPTEEQHGKDTHARHEGAARPHPDDGG